MSNSSLRRSSYTSIPLDENDEERISENGESSTLMSESQLNIEIQDQNSLAVQNLRVPHPTEEPLSTCTTPTESIIRTGFANDNRRSKNLQTLRTIIKNCMIEMPMHLQDVKMLCEQYDFLQILFNLFDYTSSEILDQREWIEFLSARLMNSERGTDFVEIIESLAFAYFGEKNLNFERFQIIFKSPAVSKKLFRLAQEDCKGNALNLSALVDFISRVTSPRLMSHLPQEHIEYLRKLFRSFAKDEGVVELSKEKFSKILPLPSKEDFFTQRVFEIFDHDSSGSISEQEFLDTLIRFASLSDERKVSEFLFVIYDINSDGMIQMDELKMVLSACIRESKLTFSDEQVDTMTLTLFEDADTENRGSIDFNALKMQLEKHPGVLKNMSISIGKWLIPPKPGPSVPTKTRGWNILGYLRNNSVFLGWFILIILFNVGLFTQRFISFRKNNPTKTIYLVMARSAGQCLNFNCTILLVWMLRHTLTILRVYGIGKLFPLDHHVYFHKLCGFLVFTFGIIHGVFHFFNIGYGILVEFSDAELTYFEVLFDPLATNGNRIPQLKLGLIPGWAFNSGVGLIVILFVIVICAMPIMSKSLFYPTHLLYWVFWSVLIIHAPNFWKWFIGPGVIFMLERIHRLHRLHLGGGKTCIKEGVVLPSMVTKLVIPRPPYFYAKPGDYIFIQIPKISLFEWHPFTISSSPEEDVITVHIRGVGPWTKKVHNLFMKKQRKLKSLEWRKSLVEQTRSLPAGCKLGVDVNYSRRMSRVDICRNVMSLPREIASPGCKEHPEMDFRRDAYRYMRNAPVVIELGRSRFYVENTPNIKCSKESIEEKIQEKKLQVYIDGPYGAPASNIFDAEHAVLIATGIGVTPFASILQSIMFRYVSSKIQCPGCNMSFCNGRPSSLENLKKVDFIWINRDQIAFEWFVQILSKLEIEQAELGNHLERFLDMHMYITSAVERNDMKASLLQLALDLVYLKERRDLISGLSSRTSTGRPNWDKVFKQIKAQKKGSVSVFFCGQPAVAEILNKKCQEFGFQFRQEIF